MAAVLSGAMLLLNKALRPRVALQQKHSCSDQTVTYQSVADNISVSELSPNSQKMVEEISGKQAASQQQLNDLKCTLN